MTFRTIEVDGRDRLAMAEASQVECGKVDTLGED